MWVNEFAPRRTSLTVDMVRHVTSGIWRRVALMPAAKPNNQ